MMFSVEDEEKLKRSFSRKADFGGKFYHGNKLDPTLKKNMKVTKKQRKIDHLKSRQRTELFQLHGEFDRMLVANSKVSRSNDPNKKRKRDYKTPGKLGAEGIHSTDTFETYKKRGKTFLKYCYEHFGTKEINAINDPEMLKSFLKDQKDRGNSAKTLGNYVSAIKKLAEFVVSDASPIKAPEFRNILTEDAISIKGNYKKEDYRRGKAGGYTMREAKVMIKQAGNLFSAREQTMLEVLTYAGTRIDELLGIKWRQLDYENNRIYLTDKNQGKNGRPRFVELPAETMQKLKAIWDGGFAGKNTDTRIWGSKLSEDDVRAVIRDCCRAGKIGYSGAHDFRKATVEHLEKQITRGKASREDVADKILDHVNEIADKNGNKPLNPIVEKKKTVYIKNKNGKYVPSPQTIRDEEGGVVRGPRFEKSELLKLTNQQLVKKYMAQVLGHNRETSVNPYRRG